jgi:putative membrane protein insertion efficiency factor
VSAPGSRGTLAARAVVGLVRLYQYTFAGVLGGRCRFHPSCSEYAIEALRTHGAVRGGVLAVRRFVRCQPLGGHGVDPVPPRR